MKRVNWLLVIIVMIVVLLTMPWWYAPGWAYGAGPTSCVVNKVISSLPYTSSDTDTCLECSGNLSSATNGILFDNSSNNVTLFLGDDTITFGTGNGDDNYGIKFFGDSYDGSRDITVKGGAVVHGASDTTADGNRCFLFGGGCEILLDSIDAMVLGYNAHVLMAPTSGWKTWDVEVRGGHWTTNVTGYTSRCDQDGAGVIAGTGSLVANTDTVSGFSYHWNIHDLVLDTCPNAGLYMSGKLRLYNLDVLVDARNDFYTYPSGNVCYGSTNSGCIAINRVQAGSIIRKNNLRAGVKWFGADEGVLIETSLGTITDTNWVDSNTIDVHRGEDAYYLSLNAKGIKGRYHNTYTMIEHNDITVTVGDSSGNTAYGPKGVGLEIITYDGQGCDWGSGEGPDTSVLWQKNTVVVQCTDSITAAIDAESSPNNTVNGVRIALKDTANYSWGLAGNRLRWNNITSPHNIYKMGGYDAAGRCDSALAFEDTVQWDVVEYDNVHKYVFDVGHDDQAFGNVGRDLKYNGKTGDSVTAGTAIWLRTSGGGEERDISLERTLNITINDGDGSPIEGAIFTAVDDYDNTQITDTTGADGIASGVARYRREFRTLADSTAYNDFTFTARRPAGKVRLSYMFTHYSVGLSAMINNTTGPNAPRNILDVLDTTTITYENDTARFVFRSYNINFDHEDSALGDTVPTGEKIDYINSDYDYDWQSVSVNRNRIAGCSGDLPCVLKYMWERDGKTDSVNNAGGSNFWQPLAGEHYIDYGGSDSAWESYDMVVFKNPYMIWQDITQPDIDSAKVWYARLRDSIVLYPNVNVCLIMGTPLCYQADSDADFDSDTVLAKMVYDLATWFASDSFFTHTSGGGAYDNLWKFDPYRLLCETDEVENRYCLKDSYWMGAGGSSHLSGLGAEVLQDTIIGFVRTSALELLETTATTSGDYTVAWDRYDTTLVLGKVGTAEGGGSSTRTRLRGFKP